MRHLFFIKPTDWTAIWKVPLNLELNPIYKILSVFSASRSKTSEKASGGGADVLGSAFAVVNFLNIRPG